MLRLGEKQVLKVKKEVDFGVYLTDGNEDVLLPAKQVPTGTKIGDEIEIFLYKDSEDRIIATTKNPLIVRGRVARLEVLQVTGIGAFLDWGLDKDLFLPFKEQTYKPTVGDGVLVRLYIDKSERLCASMNVYEDLRADSVYVKDSSVQGTVYQVSDRFGAFVAVDDMFSALIPRKALYGADAKVKPGQKITARVANVLDDGRLELAVRQKSYMQRDTDAEAVMKLIEENNGVLPFSDKASPELIGEKTGMSKAQFKRAVGKLYKDREILIENNCIRKN